MAVADEHGDGCSKAVLGGVSCPADACCVLLSFAAPVVIALPAPCHQPMACSHTGCRVIASACSPAGIYLVALFTSHPACATMHSCPGPAVMLTPPNALVLRPRLCRHTIRELQQRLFEGVALFPAAGRFIAEAQERVRDKPWMKVSGCVGCVRCVGGVVRGTRWLGGWVLGRGGRDAVNEAGRPWEVLCLLSSGCMHGHTGCCEHPMSNVGCTGHMPCRTQATPTGVLHQGDASFLCESYN
jgi:hypothetical protein